MESFPVLYVMVRNDLDSMNPGKAEAHSGHACSAFAKWYYKKNKEKDLLAIKWHICTSQGFGTQINLDANFKQMKTAVEVATMLKFTASLVTDPTYPYEMTNEAASLIPEELDTLPRIYKGDKVVMFREEVTAAYVFGDKNDPMFETVMGRFRLKP